MLLLALPLALLLPTVNGWLSLRLLEGRRAALFAGERWVMGCVLGLTAQMFLSFALQVLFKFPFSLLGFGITHIVCFAILGQAFFWHRKKFEPSPKPHHSTLLRWQKITLGILLGIAAVKIFLAGTMFLLLTPSYLQDTLKNWNLRGKVFYETEQLTLVMPNEDPIQSPKDISSYPPTVPMVKTWIADVAGSWDDGLINSVHIVWYLAAIALVYFALRRYASTAWSLLGVYGLVSMPLYLMHGTNAYADAFVSAHVFIAISVLFHAMRAEHEETRNAFLRIGAFAAVLLAFTKNEGLLVHLLPLLFLTGVVLLWKLKEREIDGSRFAKIIGWYAAFGFIPAFWLGFKWWRRLTFGNGKAFTSLGFGWQPFVTQAIFINTFFEGNWLLLFPMLFALIVWRWRAAFGKYLPLTAFFCMVYFGQMLLYLFTSLSTEALMQTGYARGLVQLMPTIVVLTTFLLRDAWETIGPALSALAVSLRLKPRHL